MFRMRIARCIRFFEVQSSLSTLSLLTISSVVNSTTQHMLSIHCVSVVSMVLVFICYSKNLANYLFC